MGAGVINLVNMNMYVNWYRDVVVPAINDPKIAPPLNRDEILNRGLISPENWMLVPSYDLINREVAKISPKPNIWFSLDDSGMSLGIAYNTVEAVDRLLNILDNYCRGEKEELILSLKNLDDRFTIVLDRKIKPHFSSSPIHKRVAKRACNQVTNKFFEDFIHLAESIREEGIKEAKEKNWKTPKLFPYINIAQADFDYLDKKTLSEYLKQLKPVFILAYNVKSQYDIKKGKIKIMNRIKENESEISRLNKLKKLPLPKNDLARIESKIQQLEKEIEGLKRKL